MVVYQSQSKECFYLKWCNLADIDYAQDSILGILDKQ